jgi:TolA-binding protein
MNRKCRANTPSGTLSRLESMGRLSSSLLALALAAALAVGLSACGGSGNDLLPGTAASEINSNLDEVRQLVGEGNCAGAGEAASSVSDQIAELGGVDKELKEALDEGAARLNEVVASCEEVPSETEEEATALEEAGEAEREAEEEDEKPAKPEKEKPGKEKTEKETGPPPESPGQEKQEEEAPPAEPEGSGNSGGVGPGAAVEGGK